MDSLKKIWTRLEHSLLLKIDLKNQKNKILLVSFVLLGILALVSGYEDKKEEAHAIPAEKNPTSVDTYIPRGYVLVPIEVANANSLSSLLGEMGGVVDLYLAQGQKTSLKIASKLKILRAPLNPDMYAVLVREQESAKILSYAGPFIAVVQNPTVEGQKVTDTKQRKISVDYQN